MYSLHLLQTILKNIDYYKNNKIQLIWQTGKWMYQEAKRAVEEKGAGEWVKVYEFVSKMDAAYAAADVVVSRAGAIAISELCLVGKPVILIPSPNVAEDHQTKNAMALVKRGAAEMVKDAECQVSGIDMIDKLLNDKDRCASMGKAIKNMGVRQAADRIVDEIEKLLK